VRITVDTLWKLFVEAKTDVLAPKTIYRYSSALVSLDGFCRDKNIADVSDDDIFAWAEHRRDADDIKPRVINRNDLAAVRSVFGWATTHQGGKLLKTNPAKGVRLDEPRHAPKRERSFREAEVRAILSAALSVEVGVDNPSLARAKRWCPWLDAYSGARIAELTALEASDVWLEHGVWVMHFDQTKTRMPRTVPIHEHLIEQGFLEFVREIGAGPLFFDPGKARKPNAMTSPSQLRAQEVATWVRQVSNLDPEVDPNHGWRHTFKSRALDIIDIRIRDYIVGHIPTTPARKYEHPPIEAVAAAMARFPRYSIKG
jgi:integrase